MPMNMVSLKEHLLDKIKMLREDVSCRFKELEAKLQIRFDMSNDALNKAEQKMNDRLAGMNEFRDALKDQASTFITKNEVELKLEAERKGRKDNLAMLISVIAVVISLAIVIIKLLPMIR